MTFGINHRSEMQYKILPGESCDMNKLGGWILLLDLRMWVVHASCVFDVNSHERIIEVLPVELKGLYS